MTPAFINFFIILTIIIIIMGDMQVIIIIWLLCLPVFVVGEKASVEMKPELQNERAGFCVGIWS